MPSPDAKLSGDITMFASGYWRHQALSTSSPNAVSAAPYGRGSADGSAAATPWSTRGFAGGDGAGAKPHPATKTVATKTGTAEIEPAAARSLVLTHDQTARGCRRFRRRGHLPAYEGGRVSVGREGAVTVDDRLHLLPDIGGNVRPGARRLVLVEAAPAGDIVGG